MNAPILGILLTFYDPYVDRALAQFERMLRSLSRNYRLIVVHNGKSLPQVRGDRVEVIAGDNSLREFSGWQVGLDAYRARNAGKNPDLAVLANDTFCHHNKFGGLTQWAFRKTLRQLLHTPTAPALAGERFCLAKPYVIDGLHSDAWISTYLFGISKSLLDDLPQVTPAAAMELFYASHAGRLGFSGRVSPNLARSIEAWLLGSSHTRWKGAAVSGATDLGALRGKANSILCEKYLSALAVSKGAALTDVFASSLLRKARRAEAILPRLRSALGAAKGEIYGG